MAAAENDAVAVDSIRLIAPYNLGFGWGVSSVG